MSSSALLALALLAAPRGGEGELVTAAAATPRPADCSARSGAGRSPSVWERARVPARAAFCRAIAEAHARLGSDLAGAEAALRRAEEAWADRPATKIAAARVHLARGDAKAAIASIEAALAEDPGAAVGPQALHAHARALALVGRGDEAVVAYRALVPQAALLPATDRVGALLEAGVALMAQQRASAPEVTRAASLDEALAILREAYATPGTTAAGDAALVLSLALDRAGDPVSSAARLADARRLGAGESAAQRAADPAEALAIQALLAETTDRARAAALWDRYLAEAGGSAHRAAAERRREGLRGAAAQGSKGPRRPRSPKR